MQRKSQQGFRDGSGNRYETPEVTWQGAPELQAQPPKNGRAPLFVLGVAEPFPGEDWAVGVTWRDGRHESVRIRPVADRPEVAQRLRDLANAIERGGQPQGCAIVQGRAHEWAPVSFRGITRRQCVTCGCWDTHEAAGGPCNG